MLRSEPRMEASPAFATPNRRGHTTWTQPQDPPEKQPRRGWRDVPDATTAGNHLCSTFVAELAKPFDVAEQAQGESFKRRENPTA